MCQDSSKASSTALVLLNTRVFRSYECVKDMVKPNAKTPWGNYIAFLHVPIPELTHARFANPLEFVLEAQQIINGKKNSLACYLTGGLLEILKKVRGPEVHILILFLILFVKLIDMDLYMNNVKHSNTQSAKIVYPMTRHALYG